jgi:multicomponent Na+:H+ antiporter subunit E
MWFALSGQTSPLFVIFAVLSVAAVVALCLRLGLTDRGASPYHRAAPLALYALWLLVEIARSNIAVLRLVLFSPGRVSPGFVHIPAPGGGDLAAALLANSVTLTPGTVTISASDGGLIVHALTQASPEDFELMARRAARAAGRERS